MVWFVWIIWGVDWVIFGGIIWGVCEFLIFVRFLGIFIEVIDWFFLIWFGWFFEIGVRFGIFGDDFFFVVVLVWVCCWEVWVSCFSCFCKVEKFTGTVVFLEMDLSEFVLFLVLLLMIFLVFCVVDWFDVGRELCVFFGEM